MRKNPSVFLSTFAVLLLTVLILAFPSRSLYFACNGLNLWFQKMIPALFPFMVLSGIMIRMNLTDSFVKLLKPLLQPVFQVSSNCIYTIIIGFLCGFPMGAGVTAQLYERNRITRNEADFLLAFCNNIGPVYFLTFALPVIGTGKILPCLFGMYGIPLFYGIILRYTVYKKSFSLHSVSIEDNAVMPSFLQALDESVMASLTNITKLGGYMIFFNLLNLIPALIFQGNDLFQALIGAFLEITGGIQLLGNNAQIFSLCLLTFGGLSCIAQTNSMIQGTGLSLNKYILHKLILTAICAVYYSALI